MTGRCLGSALQDRLEPPEGPDARVHLPLDGASQVAVTGRDGTASHRRHGHGRLCRACIHKGISVAKRHFEGPTSEPAFLARVPPHARQLLLEDVRTVRVNAAEVVFAATDRPRVGVLLVGRARRFLAAGDGRQVTTGYLGPGDLVGNGALFGIGLLAVGALSACVVAEFPVDRFVRLTREDRATGEAFAEATTELVREGHAGLKLTTFGSMRERVAHHLVALAAEEPLSGALAIAMTQQRLAECVGTVREVVARTLRDFRDEGLVVTAEGRVEILDAARLARVAVGRWVRGIDGNPAARRSGTEDLDASPHAIIGVQSSGLIVYANAHAERLFGRAVGELVGTFVDRLVASPVAARHREAVAAYLETDRSRRPMAGGMECSAVRPDGSDVPITCRLAVTDTVFGQVAFATFTERAPSPT